MVHVSRSKSGPTERRTVREGKRGRYVPNTYASSVSARGSPLRNKARSETRSARSQGVPKGEVARRGAVEGPGRKTHPGPSPCPYSPECVEGGCLQRCALVLSPR